MPLSLSSLIQKYFRSWAFKRAPRSLQVILRQKTIYIFPSRQGLAFLAVVLLIWLLGTNYQNNLILGFAFFLLSIMIVSMIHAFNNMLGLTFTPAATQSAMVDEIAPFGLVISSQNKRAHHAILLATGDASVLVNLGAGQTESITLGVKADRRGWFRLPRITVKSYFPFGLIRAWAYVELEHRALIFPAAIASDTPPLASGQGAEGQGYSPQRGDEFQGFQTYQPGAPASQIAWKQFARGAGLHLKDYRAIQAQQYWLDWQQLKVRDPERGLSHLCYWVNVFADTQNEFGLKLPGTQLEMGSGDVHRIQALTTLALFDTGVKREVED